MKTKTKNTVWYKAQALIQRLEGGGGTQVRGSGSALGYKGDIEKDDSLYEVKSCTQESFYLKFNTLTKASEEALAYAGRLPAVYIVMTQYGIMKLVPEWDDTTPRPPYLNKLLFEPVRARKGVTIPKHFWEGHFNHKYEVQIHDGTTWWAGWKMAGTETTEIL